MKKIMLVLLACLLVAGLCACGGSEPKHTLEYENAKRITVPFNDTELKCVGVFTQYTNKSGESAIPADNTDVKAYQNGVALSPWVFTGQKTENYIQCDTSVQDGTTASVIWIFELEDDSPITVEMNGTKYTID